MYRALLKLSITGENRRHYATGAGLLPLPHVQFWQTENSWRLDRSHCGRHRRNISGLVDASDVRTVNAVEIDRGHRPYSINLRGQRVPLRSFADGQEGIRQPRTLT
jgi:hypothetical protein